MTQPDPISYRLINEAATVEFGRQLAASIGRVIGSQALCVYLLGDLGAGKTTLSRGIIQAFGHRGAVKSPTYTLVEPYEIKEGNAKLRQVYHFDLYRLADAAELEFLGLDDYFSGSSICLIEWPARGAGFIPEADIILTLSDIEWQDGQASVMARRLDCQCLSAVGQQVLLTLPDNQDSAWSIDGVINSTVDDTDTGLNKTGSINDYK